MPETGHADTVLINARVLTMDPWNPRAWFAAVKDGRILATGSAEAAPQFKGRCTKQIDCQGMTLMPGFNDAHCHLMALASSLTSVDCRPEVTGSISRIVEAIRPHARSQQGWIRAFGYDEFHLAEKRHPTRWDLDRAAPFHPVRLDHRTGHASVLNSRALEMVNITKDTHDPTDGVIERDQDTGEPTGLLFEMGGYLRKCVGTRRDEESFLDGISKANGLLLSKGITSVQDASPGNDLHRWQTLLRLKEEGHVTPRVTMMVGQPHLPAFLDQGHQGPKPGFGDEDLRLGAVKLMLSLTTGTLQPGREELRETVLQIHRLGFQLAIHAVEEEAIDAAADALLSAQAALPRADARHRIEHCSECPPPVRKKLKASGAIVVTQPGFIYHNGEKYLALVDKRLLPHLYPVRSIGAAGIPVAAGSDAPVTRPDPLLGAYSAVTRQTRDGPTLCPSQAIPVREALKLHCINAAFAAFEEKNKGSVVPGKLADLVLLDADPSTVEPEGIKEIRAMMTVVDGEVVWRR